MSEDRTKERQITRRIYRVKGASFTPIFYLYSGAYQDGQYLGDCLAYFVIAVSFVVGMITGNYSVDLVCWALAFGSFVYNYRVMGLMNKGCKAGYFTEGESNFCFHTLKRFSVQMVMLSRFFELYSIFLISVLLPGIIVKIVATALVMVMLLVLRYLNNVWDSYFWKSKKTENLWKTIKGNLVIRNLRVPVLFLVGGTILSRVFEIRPYYNIGLILIAVSVGFLRYVLDKNIRRFFTIEQYTIKNKTQEMDVIEIADLFKTNITQKGEKNYREIKLERLKKEKEEEDERRREAMRKMVKKKLEENYEEERKRWAEERKEIAERKAKEAEKKRLEEARRKAYNGEKLTEEEKKVISKEEESIYKPSGLETVSSDRTKARR